MRFTIFNCSTFLSASMPPGRHRWSRGLSKRMRKIEEQKQPRGGAQQCDVCRSFNLAFPHSRIPYSRIIRRYRNIAYEMWNCNRCVTVPISRYVNVVVLGYYLLLLLLQWLLLLLLPTESRNSLLISYAFHQIAAAHAHAKNIACSRSGQTTEDLGLI